MKNLGITIVGIIALGGLLWWAGGIGSGGEDVVAKQGLHWHPTLTIYSDEIKQDIPANVGLVGGHYPMHTHVEDVADGVLHLEFGETVRTEDLLLTNFFDIWGKDIATAFGALIEMRVNGEVVGDYTSYIIGENDAIELFYSSEE
tara:strand:+ start:7450 stop:7884 length:435 start_codon:yes stop_codon:yes gene_type:complete